MPHVLEATIYANVLAILSFTLNRVYTEWYRGYGYISPLAFNSPLITNATGEIYTIILADS